ncbi:MAG: glycosyltransferase family 2 protein [Chloroflexi bacterium]|nr:glycosyltransferase family 2 protein [Chloroflexota bacterium]
MIIPAHNEERRLPGTLEQVFNFLQTQSYTAEVLVVENGSQDNTLKVAQDFAADCSPCRILQADGRGKGLAVRQGMIASRGQYRFMCDADLSMPIAEVNRFLPPARNDFDIAIASREAPGSIRYHEPAYRHWGGRGINLIIRTLALPGLHDTQCGFKCFRAPIAEDLFTHQTLTNWSFDIELLYIARRRGFRIVEVPIPWYYSPETKINPIRDALQMMRDIITIRRNARRGLYDLQT